MLCFSRPAFLVMTAMLSFAAGAVFSGCKPAEPPVTQTPAQPTDEAEMPAEVAAALAELSEEDRRAAAQQRICPVTEELLGSMGMPVKVVVEDRVVFLCCSACENELRANPNVYLAKLDAA